jgi:hypothetical protein
VVAGAAAELPPPTPVLDALARPRSASPRPSLREQEDTWSLEEAASDMPHDENKEVARRWAAGGGVAGGGAKRGAGAAQGLQLGGVKRWRRARAAAAAAVLLSGICCP